MTFKPYDGNAARASTPLAYPLGSESSFADRAGVQLWLGIVLLALATLLIRWPWLGGEGTFPWDAKAHFQPQIQFLAHSLAEGQSPFWAPYVFSGHPQIADPQASIFSPPFLLLALFTAAPGAWAIDATVIGMVFVGGCALMLWFRDQGWHWAGGLLAALVFCYGASMAWRIQHFGQVLSLAYLPLAMLCLERALARRSIVYGVAAGVVAALLVLGRDQVALLTLYFLAGLTLWRLLVAPSPLAAVRTGVLPLAAAGVTAAALAAVPILLTALLAAESNRPSFDFLSAGRGSLHPALLLTLIAPDLYGGAGRMEDYWGPPSFAWADTGIFLAQNMGQLYLGAIPVILTLMAAARGRLWAGEVRFFSIAFAVAGLYALGWYTPVFRVIYEVLPGIGLYRRPADATFLIGALAAILAGYSTHRLFIHPAAPLTKPLVYIVLGVIAAGFEIAIALGYWLDRLPRLPVPLGTAAATFLLGAGVLALARRRIAHQPALAAAVIVAFTAADLAINNGPGSASAQPRAMYEVLEPASKNLTIALLKGSVVQNETRRDRIELAGLGFHWPNASLTHRLENTLGYNPLRLALYSAATGADDHVGLPDQRKFTPLFPSYRSKLADLIGLRFIATGVPVEQMDRNLKPGDLTLVARTADGYVYENTAAMDRVLFATEARSADFARLLKDGAWPDADLRTTVLLEAAPSDPAARAPGSVRILDYRNTEVVVEADSPSGGWVVLNDLWHPWWFAEIDGKPTELLRANVLFRAVEVPPGKHTVRFVFRPLAGGWQQLTGSKGHTKGSSLAVQPTFSARETLEPRAHSGTLASSLPRLP
jgi:hypothetical protein